MPPQTARAHADLVLKGVDVEIIELMGVRVALRTYVSVNCTHKDIHELK